jgi:hypothetical protein
VGAGSAYLEQRLGSCIRFYTARRHILHFHTTGLDVFEVFSRKAVGGGGGRGSRERVGEGATLAISRESDSSRDPRIPDGTSPPTAIFPAVNNQPAWR